MRHWSGSMAAVLLVCACETTSAHDDAAVVVEAGGPDASADGAMGTDVGTVADSGADAAPTDAAPLDSPMADADRHTTVDVTGLCLGETLTITGTGGAHATIVGHPALGPTFMPLHQVTVVGGAGFGSPTLTTDHGQSCTSTTTLGVLSVTCTPRTIPLEIVVTGTLSVPDTLRSETLGRGVAIDGPGSFPLASISCDASPEATLLDGTHNFDCVVVGGHTVPRPDGRISVVCPSTGDRRTLLSTTWPLVASRYAYEEAPIAADDVAFFVTPTSQLGSSGTPSVGRLERMEDGMLTPVTVAQLDHGTDLLSGVMAPGALYMRAMRPSVGAPFLFWGVLDEASADHNAYSIAVDAAPVGATAVRLDFEGAGSVPVSLVAVTPAQALVVASLRVSTGTSQLERYMGSALDVTFAGTGSLTLPDVARWNTPTDATTSPFAPSQIFVTLDDRIFLVGRASGGIGSHLLGYATNGSPLGGFPLSLSDASSQCSSVDALLSESRQTLVLLLACHDSLGHARAVIREVSLDGSTGPADIVLWDGWSSEIAGSVMHAADLGEGADLAAVVADDAFVRTGVAGGPIDVWRVRLGVGLDESYFEYGFADVAPTSGNAALVPLSTGVIAVYSRDQDGELRDAVARVTAP